MEPDTRVLARIDRGGPAIAAVLGGLVGTGGGAWVWTERLHHSAPPLWLGLPTLLALLFLASAYRRDLEVSRFGIRFVGWPIAWPSRQIPRSEWLAIAIAKRDPGERWDVVGQTRSGPVPLVCGLPDSHSAEALAAATRRALGPPVS